MRKRIIDHFKSRTGTEYRYDSTKLVIRHDRGSDRFSWWAIRYFGDKGEILEPVYKMVDA